MKIFVFGKNEGSVLALFMLLMIGLCVFIPYGVKTASTSAPQKKLPIYSVQTAEKKLAVTFDCAWANSDTDALIKILKKHNAKATFFVTGEWVSKYPEDVLKFYTAGHEIANHSDSHAHINKMSAAELSNDIKACNDKIKAVTGSVPLCYRGPYGEYNNTLLSGVEKLKMFAVQWDTDSRDWQKKSVDYMVNSVCKNAKEGSIVLFHNDLENTPAALDRILEYFSNEGYSFVTASDLIYKENYTIRHDGTQCKIKDE